jgi:hypothetical protein
VTYLTVGAKYRSKKCVWRKFFYCTSKLVTVASGSAWIFPAVVYSRHAGPSPSGWELRSPSLTGLAGHSGGSRAHGFDEFPARARGRRIAAALVEAAAIFELAAGDPPSACGQVEKMAGKSGNGLGPLALRSLGYV